LGSNKLLSQEVIFTDNSNYTHLHTTFLCQISRFVTMTVRPSLVAVDVTYLKILPKHFLP